MGACRIFMSQGKASGRTVKKGRREVSPFVLSKRVRQSEFSYKARNILQRKSIAEKGG